MILQRGSTFVFAHDRFPYVLKVIDFGDVDGVPGILAQNYAGGDVVFIDHNGIDSIRLLNVHGEEEKKMGFDIGGQGTGISR